jgi:serine/threonine protein kinase
MTIAAGTRLGPYEVAGLLGAGGMGQVYAARDVRLGRELALKVLPATGADAATGARFLREARAASALNHPNIVTVFDIGSGETGSFIAMELVRGRALRQLGATPLDPRVVADVGRQVARALEVAHAAGIVHRDVKPDNVMVRDDGLVKVLDFGIARLLEDAPSAAAVGGAVTLPGLAVGTVRYMSPEQACGDVVGTASDVFSLGLVLYELATGMHPFAATSDLAMLGAICAREPAPPSQVAPGLPPAFDALLLAMLAKEPSARPTAARVSQALAGLAVEADVGSATAPVATTPAPAPLVGRERERALLEDALTTAAAGYGSIFCVVGEAGLGKTTLVERALLDVRRREPRLLVARGHCSERLARAEAYLRGWRSSRTCSAAMPRV